MTEQTQPIIEQEPEIELPPAEPFPMGTSREFVDKKKIPYDPSNWYWIVDKATDEVYSSAAADYVPVTDSAYTAWLESGGKPTPIDTEENLADVFAAQYPAGWPGVVLKQQAQAALNKSDITVIRCAENGVTVTKAWITYRATLRTIINTGKGKLPSQPSYPAGT